VPAAEKRIEWIGKVQHLSTVGRRRQLTGSKQAQDGRHNMHDKVNTFAFIFNLLPSYLLSKCHCTFTV